MHSSILSSDLDVVFIMFPFIALMLVGMFRLDEHFAASGGTPRHRRAFCGPDADGAVLLSDPDGRPWPTRRRPGISDVPITLEMRVSKTM